MAVSIGSQLVAIQAVLDQYGKYLEADPEDGGPAARAAAEAAAAGDAFGAALIQAQGKCEELERRASGGEGREG